MEQELSCLQCKKKNPRFVCRGCRRAPFCGDECYVLHWSDPIHGHYKECNKLVILAPHRCFDERNDISCDLRSWEMAKTLSRELSANALLSSHTHRSIVDVNREEGRNSPMRVRLRRFMNKNPYACILEIHSFPREALEDWKLPKDTTSVIFELSNSPLERRIRKATRSGRVRGDRVRNDIANEALQNHWNHILIELREDMSGFGEFLRRLKDAIK